MDDVVPAPARAARHRQGPLRHRLRPPAARLVAAVWRHRARPRCRVLGTFLLARAEVGAAGEGCPERPAADYPSDQPRAAGAHRRRGRRVEARGQDAAAERSGERHAARGRDGSGARRCRHRGALIQSQRTDFRDSSLVASTKPTDFRVGPPAPGTGSPPGIPAVWPSTGRRSRRGARIVGDRTVAGQQIRLGRGVRVAIGVGAVVFGVLAEWLGGAWPSPLALADLAVGWVLIDPSVSTPRTCRAADRHLWLRMVPGNAGRLGIGVLAIVGALALTIHRAPWSTRSSDIRPGEFWTHERRAGGCGIRVRGGRTAARDDVATILIATTLVASTIWMYYWSTGPQRQARRTAVAAAAVLAMPLRPGASGDRRGPDPILRAWTIPPPWRWSGSSWRPICRAAAGRTPR